MSYIITKDESKCLDILKVYLSIMVVFIHSSSDVNFVSGSISAEKSQVVELLKYLISESVARCAVPAFFIMSSIFLYSKSFDWKNNIKKKIRTLMIPYVILNTFWVLFFFVAQHIPILADYFSNPENIVTNWSCIDWLDAYLGIENYPLCYPLWFVRDLFVLNLVAKIIKLLIDKYPEITMIVLIVLLLTGVKSPIFCLSTTGLCFWSLGYYIVKYNICLSYVDKISVSRITILYGCLLLVRLLLKNSENSRLTTTVYWGVVLVGTVFWFRCATFMKDKRCKKSIEFVSKYSFGVFIFHEMNLTVLKKLCAKVMPTTVLSQLLQYIVIPFVIIICCIILCVLMERFAPGLYFLVTGGRKLCDESYSCKRREDCNI